MLSNKGSKANSSREATKVSGGHSSRSASEVLKQFPLHSSLGFRVSENGCDIIGHLPHGSIHPADVERIRWVDHNWQRYWDKLSETARGEGVSPEQLQDCGSQIEGSLVLKFDEINEALDSHPDHHSTLSKFFLPNKTAWSKLVNAINDDLTPQNTLIRENGEWTAAGSLIGELLARDPVTALADEVAAEEPVVEDQVPYDQYATSSEDEQEDPGSPGVDPLEEDGDWHPKNMFNDDDFMSESILMPKDTTASPSRANMTSHYGPDYLRSLYTPF